MKLEEARPDDLPAVVALMNQAFRGTGEGASWNSEAAYIDGDRTSEALLSQEIAEKPHAVLLVVRAVDDAGLQGSVWLEPLGDKVGGVEVGGGGVWYLGSLTVRPGLQNAGLGRGLLAAAEAWIAERGGRVVEMTVVNVRDTLIAWYERRGYALTGRVTPFPYDDARFGVPREPGLAFVTLAKTLADDAGLEGRRSRRG